MITFLITLIYLTGVLVTAFAAYIVKPNSNVLLVSLLALTWPIGWVVGVVLSTVGIFILLCVTLCSKIILVLKMRSM